MENNWREKVGEGVLGPFGGEDLGAAEDPPHAKWMIGTAAIEIRGLLQCSKLCVQFGSSADSDL